MLNGFRNFRWFIFCGLLAVTSRADADSVSDQFRDAINDYKAKRWHEAEIKFDTLIEDHPADPRVSSALFFRGESLVQIKRFEEAARIFNAFSVDNPDHKLATRGQFRWAEATMFSGKLATASRLLEQFGQQHPEHALNEFTHLYLGLIAKRQDKPKVAKRYFDQLLARYPDGQFAHQAHLESGVASYRNQEFKNARKHFVWLDANEPDLARRATALYWLGITQLAEQDYSSAATTLSSVPQIDRSHQFADDATYFSGEAFRMMSQFDAAVSSYQSVAAQWPASTWNDDCLCGQIEVALRRNDQAKLQELAFKFEEQFADSPRLVDVLQASGQAALQQKKWSEAGRIFDRALDVLKHVAETDGTEPKRSSLNSLSYLASLAHLANGAPNHALNLLRAVQLSDKTSKFASRVNFVRGAALADLGQTQEAVTVLEETLQQLTTGTTAERCRAKLALVHWNSGATDESLQVVASIQSFADEAVLQSVHRIAEDLYQTGAYKAALGLFEKLSGSQDPTFRKHGISGKAWCHRQLQEHVDAAQAFEQLGNLLLSKNGPSPNSDDGAEAMLLQAKSRELASQIEIALGAYANTRRLFPDSKFAAEAHFVEAKLQAERGHDQAAVDLLSELTTSHADYEHLDAALYDLAWLLKKAGNDVESEKRFARIHEAYADSTYWSDATFRVAEAEADRKEFSKAIVRLDKLIGSREPSRVLPHALMLRAELAVEQTRWEEALPPLLRLTTDYPQHALSADAKRWLAEAYFQQEDYSASKRAFEELFALPDAKQQAWWPASQSRFAQLLVAEQNWSDAIGAARTLLKAKPSLTQRQEADYVIGRSLAGLGRYSDARRSYVRAIEQSGDNLELNAKSYFMVGESYFHQKNYPAALQAFLRVEAVYDFPRWTAAALLQAAKCHELLGADEAAARLYQRITNDYAKTEFRVPAANRLKALKQASQRTFKVRTGRPAENIE